MEKISPSRFPHNVALQVARHSVRVVIYQQFVQRAYALQKQRYLVAEGWKVILVPIEPYLEKEGTTEKEM